jgi:hypothetical protein
LALWKLINVGDAVLIKKILSENFSIGFLHSEFVGVVVSRYAAIPLIVTLSPGYRDIIRFHPWSPIATGNNLDGAEKIPKLSQTTENVDVFDPRSGISGPSSRRASACPNLHDDSIASGDFNFTMQPFILSYGVRCKVCFRSIHPTSVVSEILFPTPLF